MKKNFWKIVATLLAMAIVMLVSHLTRPTEPIEDTLMNWGLQFMRRSSVGYVLFVLVFGNIIPSLIDMIEVKKDNMDIEYVFFSETSSKKVGKSKVTGRLEDGMICFPHYEAEGKIKPRETWKVHVINRSTSHAVVVPIRRRS